MKGPTRKQFGFAEGTTARAVRAPEGCVDLALPPKVRATAADLRRFGRWLERVADWLEAESPAP